MAKQLSIKTKAGSSNKFLCPRCKLKYLSKDGKTPGGMQRWACKTNDGEGRTICYKTTAPDSPLPVDKTGGTGPKAFKRPLGGVKRFIITSAQNATPLHDGFFQSMLTYCKEHGAELVVIPIRYKNPTSRWTQSQQNADYWEVPEEYLYDQRKKLCDHLVLLGDIKVRPTAESPLTSLEGITHGESGIVGHPRLQLITIPTPQYALPKIMTTTGGCTVRNYTDSKAGKKGEFHHTFGACIVDIQGSKFHMRQVNAVSDGSFIDLDKEYRPDGSVHRAPPALGLVMGDTHVRFADPAVIAATFDPGGIVDTLNPGHLVWHDLLDGYSVNPHHNDDPFIGLAKHKAGYGNIEEEIREAITFLERYTGKRKSIVVASNHDDFFNRWIRTTDWRKNLGNAEFYLETAQIMAKSARMGDSGAECLDPFAYWVDRLRKQSVDIRCLLIDESFVLGQIECGFHGHRGPNGSRGTVKNLSRLGVRLVSGHGHSPAIEGGHTRVGTSTRLRAEYTQGPSSWFNTHCVVYGNGKRSLISIIDGEWRFM